MNPLNDLVITDTDIDWVEKIMGGDITFDDERRSIIKDLSSVDIQAFPGSGKTTVLVAKLAIVAKKWNSSTSGICVLSHTNVAREEIEKRIGGTQVGAKLLNYPHFIGTVHSFFTTHIALPWMRSHGKNIEIIETDFAIDYRWNMVTDSYKKILDSKYISKSSCCYTNQIGEISLGSFKPESRPQKYIKSIIDNSQKNGYYTFDEILLYAKEALKDNQMIPKICSKRFPLVFIDEAQDTNSFQYEMINQCFKYSVQQGFGDENQAIYNYVGEEDQSIFPRKKPLIISQSKRFSNEIAKLANPLAISNDSMEGVNTEFESNENVIFLFKKNKICEVLDAYGKCILDTFTDEELVKYKQDGCFAIGLVHNKKEDTLEKHIPKGVFDYWPQYEAKSIAKGYTPRYLIDFFRIGKQDFNNKQDTFFQIDRILQGIRIIINKDQSGNKIKNTRNLMRAFTDQLDTKDKILRFRDKLFLIRKNNLASEKEWNSCLILVKEVCSLFDANKVEGDFVKWGPILNDLTEETAKSKTVKNAYTYKHNEREIEIKLDSIHGVKGKTHLSTLVLETFQRSHRLKNILPFIYGKTPSTKNKTDNLKCHYVAMTRARGLLCLAMPIENLQQKDINKLEDKGWKIIII